MYPKHRQTSSHEAAAADSKLILNAGAHATGGDTDNEICNAPKT